MGTKIKRAGRKVKMEFHPASIENWFNARGLSAGERRHFLALREADKKARRQREASAEARREGGRQAAKERSLREPIKRAYLAVMKDKRDLKLALWDRVRKELYRRGIQCARRATIQAHLNALHKAGEIRLSAS